MREDHIHRNGLARRFLSLFLLLVGGSFLVIMSFNIWVDPSEMLRGGSTSGIIAEKNFPVGQALSVPFRIRVEERIGTLIVGSSTARYILPDSKSRIRTSPEALRYFESQPVFNAAMAGATLAMAVQTMRHTLALHEVEEILYVLNFDGWSANRFFLPDYNPDNFNGKSDLRSYARILPILWSPKLTAASIETFLFNVVPGFAERYRERRKFRKRYDLKHWRQHLADFRSRGKYGGFEFDHEAFTKLVDTIILAKERGVEFGIIASPIHPFLMEIIYACQKFDDYKNHLKLIAEIGARYSVNVVAFNLYRPPFSLNYIENSASPRDFNGPRFADGMHFNTLIGLDLVRFLKTGQTTLDGLEGVFLAPDNVDDYVRLLEDGRQAYIRSNRDVLESLMRGADRCMP